jgi:formamidopyrimidine-DNA glycosylase
VFYAFWAIGELGGRPRLELECKYITNMPEGPEVKRMADDLEAAGLVGQRTRQHGVISGVRAHGKVLFISAQGGAYVVKCNLHGRVFVGSKEAAQKARQSARLSDGRYLVFEDVSGFGWMRWMAHDEADKVLGALGPDPLQTPINGEHLRAPRKRKSTAAALLDQDLVAGVGNYIRAEAIYRAKLAREEWMQPLKMLLPAQRERLAAAINKVMQKAYDGTLKMRVYKVAGAEQEKVGGRTFYFK